MSFRDEMQQAAAIQLMMEAAKMPAFEGEVFFDKGEMTETFYLMHKTRGKLSHGEKLLVEAAYDLWTWQKNIKLLELAGLSVDRLEIVLGLFIAFVEPDFGAAVDKWILEHRRKE